MDSRDFARELHNRKVNLITAAFVDKKGTSVDIEKGDTEDILHRTLNGRARSSKRIRDNIVEDGIFDLQKGVELDEDTFQKAITDFNLEVFELPALNKFKSDLAKAASMGKISNDEIEKAKKDLGKLTKTTVSDKNGQKRTVWVKRGEDPKGGEGKPAKVAYASETKTKEEGDHIISRAKAALENPKTPQSMRTKAQEMIDHESKKWEKETTAASDYSHKDHPHNDAHTAGIKAAKENKAVHSYDKTTEQGKAKANAWEAGHKSVSAVKEKEPEYDKDLEDMYDKKGERKGSILDDPSHMDKYGSDDGVIEPKEDNSKRPTEKKPKPGSIAEKVANRRLKENKEEPKKPEHTKEEIKAATAIVDKYHPDGSEKKKTESGKEIKQMPKKLSSSALKKYDEEHKGYSKDDHEDIAKHHEKLAASVDGKDENKWAKHTAMYRHHMDKTGKAQNNLSEVEQKSKKD